MATYLWNVYVEIVQISCYSDQLILSYKENTQFTRTTLVLKYDFIGILDNFIFTRIVLALIHNLHGIFFLKESFNTLIS